MGEQTPRTVKPRQRTYPRRPILAVYDNLVLDEHGEVGTIGALVAKLPTMRSTLFVAMHGAKFVAMLDAEYAEQFPDTWQWRATAKEKDISHIMGGRAATRVSTAVHYFGWKKTYRHEPSHFHRVIDPTTMYGKKLDDVFPGTWPPLQRLMLWAQTLSNFCAEHNLEVRPTSGALAAQFLTHPYFYPEPRRKVPMAINARVRDHLPGNYYKLAVIPSKDRQYNAHYLDQKNAHHYHAQTVALPDANDLYATGAFIDLDRIVFSKPFENFYGMYCLDLELDKPRWRVPHSWIRDTECQFIFTNELPHLLDMGYRVKGVRAAWGSWRQDTGMALYGKWAEEQLARYRSGAPWLKPLLLSTYGILAAKPSYGETVFRLAKGETVVGLPAGAGVGKLTGKLARRKQKLDPAIANVLHRAMIEAGTRSDSIGLTEWLTGLGHRVLSIYADGCIVEDDETKLPPLPEPWRIKQKLTGLRFINEQAYMSIEEDKLPGFSRDARPFRGASNRAPRRVLYDALTGRPLKTDRRI